MQPCSRITRRQTQEMRLTLAPSLALPVHRIIEKPELEGTHNDRAQLMAPYRTAEIQTLHLRALSRCFFNSSSLVLLSVPWEPVPVSDLPLGEQLSPNMQPEPSLMQLHAFPSGPKSCRPRSVSPDKILSV